jgi:hypothetical protein
MPFVDTLLGRLAVEERLALVALDRREHRLEPGRLETGGNKARGTKNPNHLRVRIALGETHARAKMETPDLAAALRGTQRR